jgi:uncharacterized protein with NRDE domain
MCLIVLAWRVRPEFPLIVAANRDEFHARPAAAAAFWQDRPGVLAGRDLQAGGTWMGISRSGRFAAVTNYRGGRDPDAAESRGALVTGFLVDELPPGKYVSSLKPDRYSGFNLLVADGQELWWLSNRGGAPRSLAPGCYALGNFLLDSPDVQEVKARFETSAAALEPLFGLLAGARIVAPEYGTRCSTLVLAGTDGRVQFAERSFDAQGTEGTTARYEFSAAP